MREFAEAEIVIPDGPYEGRRFRTDRQPYTRLWFDGVDSGRYNRFLATGPTQSGKTLAAFVTPACYHLFELQETVIIGLPDMDMAGDKWREDLAPIIERSRYRELLPRRGGGSRGGKVESIQFRNGATLKFMSGGGGDKSRAGFTARVLCVTEVDGLDQAGNASREADKLTQLEARTRAYGDRKRVYLECTVSIEEGRTWSEYQAGTTSVIRLPCPHCHQPVTPERENLTGWQDAEDEMAARAAAAFACPACGVLWSEEDRRKANEAARVVHRGQEIGPDGQVTGPEPRTRTFALRWSAVNNQFATSADIAADEWRAARSADPDNAEREMRQFVWALPILPAETEDTPLDSRELVKRRDQWAKGILPPDTTHATIGVDLGKRVGWFVLLAFRACKAVHFADYGSFDIPSDDLGVEVAMLKALRDFRDIVDAGWPVEGQAERRSIDKVWIDAGYKPEIVDRFVFETDRRPAGRWHAVIGRGVHQRRSAAYSRPARTTRQVRKIGTGWHQSRLDRPGHFQTVVDVDHWKTWLHARLATPVGQAGAATFYAATSDREHITITKHLTAERQVTEFIAGRGVVTRWETISRQNHLGDAATYGCGAGDAAGFRLTEETAATIAAAITTPGEQDPDVPAATSWFAQQRAKQRGRRR